MPADNSALIAEMVADIRDLIDQGKWPAGDAVTSENTLCVEYDTSRHTVRQALKALAWDGYVVNAPGRGWLVADMTQPRMDVVTVALPDDKRRVIGEPLQTALAEQGVRCEFSTLEKTDLSGADSAAIAQALAAEHRAFVICLFTDNPIAAEFHDALAQAGRRLVIIGQAEPGRADGICPDNLWSGEQFVARAVAAGHERIAYIGRAGIIDRLSSFRLRFAGWCGAMGVRQLPLEYYLAADDDIYSGVASEKMQEWFEALRKRDALPTCVVADVFQLEYTLEVMLRSGLSVPDQCSLLVYGKHRHQDLVKNSSASTLTLFSGFDEQWEPVAGAAAQRIMARINGDQAPAMQVSIPFAEVTGDSFGWLLLVCWSRSIKYLSNIL